mgnify:CR=1 FL=1|tara:strand:- start:799 stop:1221 length:423 start_codon:yes stop_codon:yes gene_type:complete
MINKNEILKMYFMSCINIPYKWGGYNPIEGYDCSGFVQDALATIGLDPLGDQTANLLYKFFSQPDNGIIKDIASFGNLLFFGNEKRISHVSISLSEESMIEAGGGGSKVENIQNAIKYNAFVRIRPIKNRNDLYAIIKIY